MRHDFNTVPVGYEGLEVTLDDGLRGKWGDLADCAPEEDVERILMDHEYGPEYARAERELDDLASCEQKEQTERRSYQLNVLAQEAYFRANYPEDQAA